MLGDIYQTFAVVLIVLAAVGYLGLWLRRSARSGAGCCGKGVCPPPAEPDRRDDGQPFIPADRLEDLARRRARDRERSHDPDAT